ncbi:MAG: 1-phosphofructokinase [Clostridia bacterium]|nr:1-phosphofructokinase [Clostridia bacterium]
MAKIVTLMLNPSVDVMLEFESFTKAKTNRVKNKIEIMGGKGLNVSLVASSFGMDVCATGFIGKDRAEELSQVLKKSGIENAFIEVDGDTRINYKFADSSDGTLTEANSKGFSVSKEDITKLEKVIEKVLDDAEILVLTGSLPHGVSTKFYADCIEKANAKGIKTVLDASGEALKVAIEKKPYAVKPNIDELSEYFGKVLTDKQEISDVLKELNKKGVNLVVASMGAEGAYLSQNENVLFGKTFDIEFMSAVGAGDSMVGAMCYAISENLTLERMARLSIAAGCITTSKSATNLCTAMEVFTNEERVEIL